MPPQVGKDLSPGSFPSYVQQPGLGHNKGRGWEFIQFSSVDRRLNCLSQDVGIELRIKPGTLITDTCVQTGVFSAVPNT